MKVRMIIDTDTASDDAVALAMALRHPDVEVLALTTVAGNCPVEQATRNALFTAELCGSNVPVFQGAVGPLLVKARFATWFHGRDGLGDQGYPPPARKPETMDAVSALVTIIRDNPGCTLVTLGPLTNLLMALRQAPDLVELVGRCVVMGGTANAVGNVTPAAEFNLWFDPHAARGVFDSGLQIELATWELCRGEAGFNHRERKHLKRLDTPLAHFFVDCNTTAMTAALQQSGTDRLQLPDPVAMAIALDRDGVVTEASRHYVEVEADSPLTRGMSVVDSLDVTGESPNVEVVRSIDIVRFKQMVFEAAGG